MKDHIAVIEDIAEMANLLRLYLVNDGYEVALYETAEDALTGLAARPADLVLLDLNLPGMNGFAFLERFRRSATVPVLIVSARSADEDIITGLGYGADEFATKPFSPQVLVARVRALLRRSRGQADQGPPPVTFGPYSFDRDACLLKRGDERLPLSSKEFGVLDYLISQDGKPSTPETIYRAVWKTAYGDLTAVAVYIQRLRKKLEVDPGNPAYLITVPGMGYRFQK